MLSKDQEKKWSEFYSNKLTHNYPKWPNETIVKLFFGSYLKDKPVIQPGQKLLDVGCGYGQSFMPFLQKEIECHGVEIDPEICAITERIFKEYGYSVSIAYGNNQNIPYPDESFDYILSLNAIHYEPDEENMIKAIAEHFRVLKSGGKLFIMTVGPEHDIYRKAKALGNHRYEIQDFDFRNGQVFFYFDNLKYLEHYLLPFSQKIELGRITEDLMECPLDFLIAVATK